MDAVAENNVRIAGEAFDALATYLRSLSEGDWTDATGCSRWNMRALADHAVGEAVWFPNLVRNATQGEAMHPMSLYEEIPSWPTAKLVDRLDAAAAEFAPLLDGLSPDALETPVDLGFATLPIRNATFISAFEGVLHGWDARSVREPDAVIPAPWARQVAGGLDQLAPDFAHRKAVTSLSGAFLLDVGDGIGPLVVTVEGGKLTVERGTTDSPAATVRLNPEQYVRLIAGRLKLDSTAARDAVTIEGDRARASELNRIFGGVNNEGQEE